MDTKHSFKVRQPGIDAKVLHQFHLSILSHKTSANLFCIERPVGRDHAVLDLDGVDIGGGFSLV
jgi:hypothetical protein